MYVYIYIYTYIYIYIYTYIYIYIYIDKAHLVDKHDGRLARLCSLEQGANLEEQGSGVRKLNTKMSFAYRAMVHSCI